LTGTYRGVVAAFDAIAMVAVAFTLTRGSLADRDANVVIWGSAGAAIVAALVVLTNGPAVLAWAAIGYVLFAALLATARPVPLLLLLAVAYMPILERPRGSLVTGLAISAVTALVLRAVLPLLA
jgi:hypothetical protein